MVESNRSLMRRLFGSQEDDYESSCTSVANVVNRNGG